MNEQALASLLVRLSHDVRLGSFAWQVAALVLVIVLAWLLDRWNDKRLIARQARLDAVSKLDHAAVEAQTTAASAHHSAAQMAAQRFTQLAHLRHEALSRLMFPVSAWLMSLACVPILKASTGHSSLLQVACVMFGALAAVRLIVYVLRTASDSALVRTFERGISLMVYATAIAYLTNLADPVLNWLEAISFTLGKTKFTLLALAQGALVVSLTVLAALWLGAWIESRLADAKDVDSSTRTVVARFIRALLFVLAILVGLTTAGLDLTVLGVFGGALGVGLGLGLQRIASNYVSGFIVLLDRGLRIGDTISVDKYQGTVSAIRTRYTLIKAVDGTEAIIPNETLITSPVMNHSLTDPKVRQTVRLRLASTANLEHAFELMQQAARANPVVMKEPAPYAYLVEVAPDGFVVEVTAWVSDPRTLKTDVRSDITLEILKLFNQHGIRIAFTQDWSNPQSQEQLRLIVANVMVAAQGSAATSGNLPK